MQPLDLNLSSRPFRNNALLWTACLVGAAAVVAGTVWNVETWRRADRRYGEIAGQVRGFDDQMGDLETRRLRASRAFGGFDVRELGREALKANEVIEWKAFSWTRLFNRLEEVHPWNVHMTSVEPIFRGEAGQAANLVDEERKSVPIQLQGMAKDLDALLAFERNLFASDHFFQVEPERHAPDDRGELQFALRVTYFPESQPDAAEADGAATADAAGSGARDDSPGDSGDGTTDGAEGASPGARPDPAGAPQVRS